MSSKNLLVELFVEELPPKALKKLGEVFASTLATSLKNAGLAPSTVAVTAFASPRRLAAHLTDVAVVAADKPVAQKLMPVARRQWQRHSGAGQETRRTRRGYFSRHQPAP
jgi:glycyl-tRNA synthetase beta chain